MRAALLVLMLGSVLLLGGCSGKSGFVPTKGDLNSEDHLKRDCADPKWRDQNLGLWYSLCRQPLSW